MALRNVDPERLAELGVNILRSAGVPRDDAHLVADSLVQADLWGHHSHGILRLGWYYRRLKTGVMHSVTRAERVVDSGPVLVLDGHDGIGQVLARAAITEGIRRAVEYGVAAVGVRNSNHFGTAAYFTRMAPPEGCVALLATNSSPAMPPWGGSMKCVGANPWSIAAPAGRRGVTVMDIANTAVARGKLYVARELGEAIPEGWALDAQGQTTTDPAEGIQGVMLPMGGHKGYLISLMMDVLSGVLTGSGFGSDVHGPFDHSHPSRCGHMALVLQIEAFMPREEFSRRMDTLLDRVTSMPVLPGFDAILYPGELEARAERDAQEKGLALPVPVFDDLRTLATDAGLTVPSWL